MGAVRLGFIQADLRTPFQINSNLARLAGLAVPTVDIPNAALEMLETGFQDRLFYRVSCLDPKMVVTGYDDLPVPS